MRTLAAVLAAVGLLVGSANLASADVLKMGGTRNADGSWNGLASLETVPVGNPNNAADTRVMNDGTTGYGSVGYTYNIGKYEVTAGQYCDFLNAVAGVDEHWLYNTYMRSSEYGCMIERYTGTGTTENPYQYRVASDWANRPVNYVSFWDSCRFANWLQNGQPRGAQDNSTTEDGAYTLTEGGMMDNTVTRNGNWKWAVASEDEWYKAAYYDPNKSGGAGYWLYPTKSDTAPGNSMADPLGNNANYCAHPDAFPIDDGHYFTVAGEFQNSASPYGAFDQGGNVWEWNEAVLRYGSGRGLRGGSFLEVYTGGMQASTRNSQPGPTDEANFIGLRVVQVPEPASIALLALGGLLLARRRRSA